MDKFDVIAYILCTIITIVGLLSIPKINMELAKKIDKKEYDNIFRKNIMLGIVNILALSFALDFTINHSTWFDLIKFCIMFSRVLIGNLLCFANFYYIAFRSRKKKENRQLNELKNEFVFSLGFLIVTVISINILIILTEESVWYIVGLIAISAIIVLINTIKFISTIRKNSF